MPSLSPYLSFLLISLLSSLRLLSILPSYLSYLPSFFANFISPLFFHFPKVGKALKCVDRTLFKDWAKWCERVQGPRIQRGDPGWTASQEKGGNNTPSLFTPNIVTALWESFEPVACDIHSASHSQVKETFMKLANKPGLDFKNVFNEFADRSLSRKINRMVEREGRMSNDDKIEYIAKITAELKANLTLNKTDMASLLIEMGVTLKDHEMRLLVDAFDADGDGVVTLNEFLAFTGPKRDHHSGSLQSINNAKCCWLTTCKVTGMANAYAISNLTKNAKRDIDRGLLQIDMSSSISGSKLQSSIQMKKEKKMKINHDNNNINNNDEYNEDDNEENKDDGDDNRSIISMGNHSVVGHLVIREIKNGEKRMCVELKERQRREDILTKLGVIKNDRKNEGKGEEDDDAYDDDNDDFHDK